MSKSTCFYALWFLVATSAQATGGLGDIPTVWSFTTPTDKGPRTDWVCLDTAGDEQKQTPYLRKGQIFWFKGSTFIGFGGGYTITRFELGPVRDVVNGLAVSSSGETLAIAWFRLRAGTIFKGSHVENQIAEEPGIGVLLRGDTPTKDNAVTRIPKLEFELQDCTGFSPPA